MRASAVRAVRRGVTLRDVAVYATVLVVLGVGLDASIETLAAIGVAFVVLEVVDELKDQPGVNRHLVTAAVALVGGVAVLGILLVEGVSLAFLGLLAGSAWLLYEAVTDYQVAESSTVAEASDRD